MQETIQLESMWSCGVGPTWRYPFVKIRSFANEEPAEDLVGFGKGPSFVVPSPPFVPATVDVSQGYLVCCILETKRNG